MPKSKHKRKPPQGHGMALGAGPSGTQLLIMAAAHRRA